MKNIINKSFLSTVKDQHKKNFAEYLTSILPILSYDYNNQTLVISVLPENLIFVLKSLKLHSCCQFSCLSAVSGVDYPQRERRFEVVYDLLSVKFNSRIRVKTFVDEINCFNKCLIKFFQLQLGGNEKFGIFLVFFLNKMKI